MERDMRREGGGRPWRDMNAEITANEDGKRQKDAPGNWEVTDGTACETGRAEGSTERGQLFPGNKS